MAGGRAHALAERRASDSPSALRKLPQAAMEGEAAGAVTRLQAGGAVREGSIYVERAADREIVEALSRGDPCHVLATTQTGKSSLKLRAARKLEAAGVRCALIELSGGVSEEQWYYGLARGIVRDLRLDVDVDGFWDRDAKLSHVQRWAAFL